MPTNSAWGGVMFWACLWGWLLKNGPAVQTVALIVTVFVVAWYTWETKRIRRHMHDQLNEMTRQTELGQTPHIIAWCRSQFAFYLVNVGNGPAINLTLKLVAYDPQSKKFLDFGGVKRLLVKAGGRTGYGPYPVKVVPYLLPQPSNIVTDLPSPNHQQGN